MKGANQILINTNRNGREDEFIVPTGESWLPGVIVQRDPTVALQVLTPTGKLYNRPADGSPPAGAAWIVTEKLKAVPGGGLVTDAYAAGSRASVYALQHGDHFNGLVKDLSGTADIVKGTCMMIDDTTGQFVAETGSPIHTPLLLETVTAPAAAVLAWMEW